jgi:hypothetical protein
MLKLISLILLINLLWQGDHGKSPRGRSVQGDHGKSPQCCNQVSHQVSVSVIVTKFDYNN